MLRFALPLASLLALVAAGPAALYGDSLAPTHRR